MKLLKLTDAEMARLSLPPSSSDGGQEESYVQLQRIRVTFPKHFSLYEVDPMTLIPTLLILIIASGSSQFLKSYDYGYNTMKLIPTLLVLIITFGSSQFLKL